MEKEIWKDIPNYEGLYQVSDLGRVKSLFYNKEKILKPAISTNLYLFVNLYKEKKVKQFRVHQLVAMSFLNHTICSLKLVVDHKDNNKQNNTYSNLQIVSNRYNSIKDKKPKSGHSCIYFNSNSWLVRLRINGVKKSIGTFKKLEEAIICRDKILKELNT